MANLGNTIVNGTLKVNGSIYSKDATIAYGTCDTAAGTAAKVATINDPSWVLKTGNIIMIKFSATNSASNVTLNVNGTGTKQIAYSNNRPYTGNSNMIAGYANRSLVYMYDGTYWVWISGGYDANDNNIPSAMSWTAAATAAKTASHSNYYAIVGYNLVTFQYTNTAASALTLNINGKGAKPIYINGTASSSTNYTLQAGCYLVYYDGTNYYFRTDGKITGDITGNATTAAKLDSPVAINEVLFDGSENITITANPTPNQLSGIDLNTITTPGFYYGGGGNSCTNKPSGADAFGMIVYKTASGYVTQEFTNGNNNPLTKYIRQNTGSWSAWKSIGASDEAIISSNDTIDNIITLTKAEYEALTTKQKNTLYNITDDNSEGGSSSGGGLSASDREKLDGISESADAVSFTRSLTSGTKVGTITINGVDTEIYAPTSSGTVSFTQSLTSGTKIGTITIGSKSTDLYAPAQSSSGTIITQVTSHASGNMTANNTDKGTTSFSATGPGSGWYPTGVSINHNATIVLVNGVTVYGICMTSAGNNACSGSIYFQGNGGGNCRGTTTYYVTWAKVG